MEIINLNNSIKLILKASIYNEDVIYKCFYWYTSDFSIDIKLEDGNFIIVIQNKENGKFNFESLVEKIKLDLIDFKLRDIITKETLNIRDLLIAKAFANEEVEHSSLGEISDPVGYNPD